MTGIVGQKQGQTRQFRQETRVRWAIIDEMVDCAGYRIQMGPSER